MRVDRWLAAGFVLLAIVEFALRPELHAQPYSSLLSIAFAIALAFRRHHAFAATVLVFSIATITTLVQIHFALPEMLAMSGACILLLPYSLCRWASLRHVVIGAGVMVMTWAVSIAHGEMKGVGDAIGGAVVMFFPGAIGAIVRFRRDAQVTEIEQARLREREQLARELHDSVAHHMTAITLQAQAARAVLATRPDDARGALAAIEDESRRTLAELRAIVGTLRDEDDPSLAPLGRIQDLASFATTTAASKPTIDVELVGDLQGVAPAVERAVFRLAQESITNALKHARNATLVKLRVAGEPSGIHLSVIDDGEVQLTSRRAGFGLVGMAERAALLHATFEAGPKAGGGWRVDAVLPRDGSDR